MAVVVTYAYPVSGTTPPTVAQTSNEVNAIVSWADADTLATVTHNFGLASTDPAALFPVVNINIDSTSTGTASATVTVTKTNTNAVTLTKSTAAGTGATLQVIILRPHSIMR